MNQGSMNYSSSYVNQGSMNYASSFANNYSSSYANHGSMNYSSSSSTERFDKEKVIVGKRVSSGDFGALAAALQDSNNDVVWNFDRTNGVLMFL